MYVTKVEVYRNIGAGTGPGGPAMAGPFSVKVET